MLLTYIYGRILGPKSFSTVEPATYSRLMKPLLRSWDAILL